MVAVLVLTASLISYSAFSQRLVELEQADKLKGAKTPQGEQFQKLLGNVVLTQAQTTIYCDSAYLFKVRNYVEAFGSIKITEGDSVTITGKRLEYDGNTRIARITKNVVFTKLATATLYTELLDFDRMKNTAYYKNGGRLVDSINVLTSRRGYYNSNTNMASFKRNVTVKNPDYTMTADSLQYSSRTKVIYFRTPTTVVSKDSSTFLYNTGIYDTKTKRSDLVLGFGESQEYTLKSKDYQLDDIQKIYRLRGDVVMASKKENLIIYGQAADYFRSKGISKVYNNAYVAKVTEQDTLFISADTLVSIESPDPKKKRLLAYHNVKIFRHDLQGKADSIEYRAADSTIYLYRDPILWSEGNQMTADSISMLIQEKTIDKIFLNVNSFVISRDTLRNFNQIKGRKMTAEFGGGNIKRVLVTGNGESIYFALEEKKKDSVDAKAMGMNKILCSSITIRFVEGKVNNLSFYTRPDANFIPPHELKDEDKRLPGFEWKEEDKPKRNDVVKSKEPLKTAKPAVSPDRKRL
jgi:lipopolysaccharide export system protein LptA